MAFSKGAIQVHILFKIRSHGAQGYIIFVSYFFIRLNGRERKILQIQPFVLDLSVTPGYGLKEQEGNLRMRATKYRIIMIAAAAVVMAGAAAVILVPRWKKGQENPKAAVQENTIRLARMDLTDSVSATGTIESVSARTVSAGVSDAEIRQIKVQEGDMVKKGQILLVFDKTDLAEAKEEAEQDLEDVKSQIDLETSAASRKLKEAQENAQSDTARQDQAVASAKMAYQDGKKEVSAAKDEAAKKKAEESLKLLKEAYDKAKSERESTAQQNRANIQNAKDSLNTMENNNKKSLRQAEKAVKSAEELLKECTVRAPISGTVTSINVEKGDRYTGGEIMIISDCDNLQVTTTVSEYDISKIAKGQRAVILTDATGKEELEGEITYVAVAAGSSSAGSGSTAGTGNSSAAGSSSAGSTGYEVRIELKEKKDALRVGMTAKCGIIQKEAGDVFAVPYDAVHTDKEGNSKIYVRDPDTGNQEVAVTKGMESDYYVEISGEGLTEGLQVIIPSDETTVDTDKEDRDDRGFGDLMSGKGGAGMPGSGGRPDIGGNAGENRKFGGAPER